MLYEHLLRKLPTASSHLLAESAGLLCEVADSFVQCPFCSEVQSSMTLCWPLLKRQSNEMGGNMHDGTDVSYVIQKTRKDILWGKR